MVRRGRPQAVESLVEFTEGGMNTSKGERFDSGRGRLMNEGMGNHRTSIWRVVAASGERSDEICSLKALRKPVSECKIHQTLGCCSAPPSLQKSHSSDPLQTIFTSAEPFRRELSRVVGYRTVL